ncbi:MAG: hypothetical protein B6243_06840 [Anaerolineaceae bacterium 4572_5.2]|nr:MAG: hypothetical protein B6243_06840 [Anaerolineaceae bacterium 4572_5.2]
MTDISRQIGNYIFNYRAAAIIEYQRKILLVTVPNADFWFNPGGRVQSGESTVAALRREMQEELGLRVTVGLLRWVIENFFTMNGLKFHELGFYFPVSLPPHPGDVLQDSFYRQLEDEELHFQWFSLDEIQSLDVRPALLKTKLLQPTPTPFEHIIFDTRKNPKLETKNPNNGGKK